MAGWVLRLTAVNGEPLCKFFEKSTLQCFHYHSIFKEIVTTGENFPKGPKMMKDFQGSGVAIICHCGGGEAT